VVSKDVAAHPTTAAGTGTAYSAIVSFARLAQAQSAFALGVARDPQVYVVAPGLALATTARGVGAAYRVDRRPVFIGGIPVLLEPQLLTIITPAQTGPDAFGNPIWDYGPAATRRDIQGWIQQDARAEGSTPGRDPNEERWLLITDDPSITGRDWIYWGTHPLGPQTFQVEGPPEPTFRPTGFHHLEATLRQVVG
jgi:hypothetical protein